MTLDPRQGQYDQTFIDTVAKLDTGARINLLSAITVGDGMNNIAPLLNMFDAEIPGLIGKGMATPAQAAILRQDVVDVISAADKLYHDAP